MNLETRAKLAKVTGETRILILSHGNRGDGTISDEASEHPIEVKAEDLAKLIAQAKNINTYGTTHLSLLSCLGANDKVCGNKIKPSFAERISKALSKYENTQGMTVTARNGSVYVNSNYAFRTVERKKFVSTSGKVVKVKDRRYHEYGSKYFFRTNSMGHTTATIHDYRSREALDLFQPKHSRSLDEEEAIINSVTHKSSSNLSNASHDLELHHLNERIQHSENLESRLQEIQNKLYRVKSILKSERTTAQQQMIDDLKAEKKVIKKESKKDVKKLVKRQRRERKDLVHKEEAQIANLIATEIDMNLFDESRPSPFTLENTIEVLNQSLPNLTSPPPRNCESDFRN